MLDELKYWTDLEDRLGVQHKVLYHTLMCCLIFDWIVRFSIYYLDVFGRFDYNRGILSLDLQIFSVPALMILYAYFWIASRERTFCLYLTYQFSRLILNTTLLSYIVDVAILKYSEHLFCKLQALNRRETCSSRNKYFITTAIIFCTVFAPLWYICNGGIYRYARDANFISNVEERKRKLKIAGAKDKAMKKVSLMLKMKKSLNTTHH